MGMDAVFADARSQIIKDVHERSGPSLAVAAVRDGEILWEEGFGWADRAERRAATEHTPYSLASISKPVTSTALMVLVERGGVDLDAPVTDYLAGATLNARAGAAE